MSKPEPVAFLCTSCNVVYRGRTGHLCESPPYEHTPLYPPSVVAGELRAVEHSQLEEAEALANIDGTDTGRMWTIATLKGTARKLAQRAKKWETK